MYYEVHLKAYSIDEMRRVVDALAAMPRSNVLALNATFEIAGRADNAAFMADMTKLGQRTSPTAGLVGT